ncbi:hypothetical protein N7492_009497 [Penicillium capsulatum]|uniref:Uncharacterized protein n=1 Tax=Penicillium capsulatum TaxID=69766 RepID=A0A9W9HX87_9EURO|nr:hypothetical protein N7492_009497 [Penicillium capsulatum]
MILAVFVASISDLPDDKANFMFLNREFMIVLTFSQADDQISHDSQMSLHPFASVVIVSDRSAATRSPAMLYEEHWWASPYGHSPSFILQFIPSFSKDQSPLQSFWLDAFGSHCVRARAAREWLTVALKLSSALLLLMLSPEIGVAAPNNA